MAIKDNVVTVTGASAAVAVVGIVPQADGSILIEVVGTAKDSLGNEVTLKAYNVKVQPGAIPAVDNLLATALSRIRILNGLE